MYKTKVMAKREKSQEFELELIDRLYDAIGWQILSEGAVFDKNTRDLAEDLPAASLDPEFVLAHKLEVGDWVQIPAAIGWERYRVKLRR